VILWISTNVSDGPATSFFRVKDSKLQLAPCSKRVDLNRRSGSAAPHLMGLRVRIPPAVWMSVSCECWV